MNCKLFAQSLGASPKTCDAQMQAHMETCSECQQLSEELGGFDRVIKSAFDVAMPASLSANALMNKLSDDLLPSEDDKVVALRPKNRFFERSRSTGWFALAASLLVGVGVLFGTWVGRVGAPLPQSLITHLHHEPNLLTADWSITPAAEVTQVLFSGGVSLNGDIGTVRHAGLCLFRGNNVPHVVVQSSKGPITLMLLPDEPISEATSFEEEGYKGLLVPIGNGSIAIIGDHSDSLTEVRDQVSNKVAWTI